MRSEDREDARNPITSFARLGITGYNHANVNDVPRERISAEAASVRLERLAFAQLPNLPALFLDFLSEFEKLADVYRGGRLLLPLSTEDVAELRESARQVAARVRRREELCRILREQNMRWGGSEAALANIRELAEPEAVAVVTGQQAGLFTGPLLTLYKAWTALHVSRSLRAQGIRAVPIFWIHSEDHDLAEATDCGVLGRDGHWVNLRYPISPEEEGRPISAIALDERIGVVLDELLRALPDSEFLPEIEALLRTAYVPGFSLVEAFARMMARLSADMGLVLLDPSDERIKRLTAGVLERAAREWPRLLQAFGARSEHLKAQGYRPQIHPDRGRAFLFRLEQGRRCPLLWDGDRFVLRPTGTTFTMTDLLREIADDPARFSPNVALRPIVQDALLPTLTYVGGPSEIAYFAQLGPMYEVLDLPMPRLCPRLSVTLVEPRAARLLEKYGLALTDLFAGADTVSRRLIERTLDADQAQRFEDAHRAVTEALQRLRPLLRAADPTLERPLDRAEEMMRRQMETLRERYLQACARRENTLLRHAQRLVLALAPHGSLQERRMNALYFLARYGDRFLRVVRDAIGLENSTHQVLFFRTPEEGIP